MKINLRSETYIPDWSNDFGDLKEALVEFVFQKVAPSSQPEFVQQFINELNLKRQKLKNDLTTDINNQK